jgi:hypothetical protein
MASPWGTGYPPPGSPTAPWAYPYFQPSGNADSLNRPVAASVLSIIGGAFMLLAGGLELFLGSEVGQFAPGAGGAEFVLSGLFGVVVGILVIVFGVMAYVQVQHHTVYGVLVLVFSVVSLVSFAGGFFVGFVLGLVGGILAIVHRPTPTFLPYQYAMPPPIQRVCPRCGRVIDPTVRFCPHCGNSLA